MKKENKNTIYESTIKLGPAIGDWTQLKPHSDGFEAATIRPVKTAHFEGIPESEIKYLHFFHYRLALRLIEKLSQDLNIKIEYHSITASQTSKRELEESFVKPLLQYQNHIQSLGTFTFLIPNELKNMIATRLSGGSLKSVEDQEMGILESTLLKAFFSDFSKLYVHFWKNIFEPKHHFLSTQYGSLSLQEAHMDEDPFTKFTVSIKAGTQMYEFYWIYPNFLIQKLLREKRKQEDPLNHRVHLNTNTQENIQIPICATIGTTEIPMSALLDLEVGDIITLDKSITSPIKLTLNDSVTLSGQPGISKNKYAIQVLSPQEKEPTHSTSSRSPFIDESAEVAEVFKEDGTLPIMLPDLSGDLDSEEDTFSKDDSELTDVIEDDAEESSEISIDEVENGVEETADNHESEEILIDEAQELEDLAAITQDETSELSSENDFESSFLSDEEGLRSENPLPVQSVTQEEIPLYEDEGSTEKDESYPEELEDPDWDDEDDFEPSAFGDSNDLLGQSTKTESDFLDNDEDDDDDDDDNNNEDDEDIDIEEASLDTDDEFNWDDLDDDI